MSYIPNNEIIAKYQIRYKFENSLATGTFVLDDQVYEFIWQHYDYQYVIFKRNDKSRKFIINMDPDLLESTVFFDTLKEMIENDKHYG